MLRQVHRAGFSWILKQGGEDESVPGMSNFLGVASCWKILSCSCFERAGDCGLQEV